MRSTLTQTLRSRWFALGIHAGLWVLLYLTVSNLGGKAPDLRAANSFSVPPQSPVPVAKLETLFAPAEWPKATADTNSPNLFFTRHFVPPASPVLPPPTTRKLELTYQGFYQTADAPPHAILKVGEAFVSVRLGASVVTNLFVAEATAQNLALTNLAGQTNLLRLNSKKEIEVPIK
jgi:hypothetical protein